MLDVYRCGCGGGSVRPARLSTVDSAWRVLEMTLSLSLDGFKRAGKEVEARVVVGRT